MQANDTNRALAISALCQAVSLVRSIAWKGEYDEAVMTPLVTSLFQFSADSIEEVYGGVAALEPGLRIMVEQFSSKDASLERETATYVLSVLNLQRLLMRNPEAIEALRRGIEVAQAQSESFGLLHENIIERLGSTYRESISTLGPRIMVQGDNTYLKDPKLAATIRTLLLTAIRAATLWQQAGGARWRLIFGRKALVREGRALLHQINA
ncbi:high frequency lysogenization protein [Ectothiorhodosinus mongolicus]|uniref:High frequency lysogenization protein HflD homolog n=1 Tax=Ectothiorhodosinus mongolicus TaxID=233100 RepID=A0A1R3VMF1_9GAMM|nr:high frequency lysogenization protein HflD [Ectothiorhodosinus mongolicus]ULX56263.1 lysogenization regulator HflD [Ectothiorhodosinus mongolicus]SIT65768.1 high frequency lysogenization protein [Ectothiorhodosinus mongolicus]